MNILILKLKSEDLKMKELEVLVEGMSRMGSKARALLSVEDRVEALQELADKVIAKETKETLDEGNLEYLGMVEELTLSIVDAFGFTLLRKHKDGIYEMRIRDVETKKTFPLLKLEEVKDEEEEMFSQFLSAEDFNALASVIAEIRDGKHLGEGEDKTSTLEEDAPISAKEARSRSLEVHSEQIEWSLKQIFKAVRNSEERKVRVILASAENSPYVSIPSEVRNSLVDTLTNTYGYTIEYIRSGTNAILAVEVSW